jgi:hypothetical protein
MLRRALLTLAFAVLVLSPRAEKHIRDRHFPEGRHTRGKSIFLKDTELPELLKLAEKSEPFRQKNGRDKRVTDAGRVIGTDGRSRKPVKTFVTISEPEDGAVITMYPGN